MVKDEKDWATLKDHKERYASNQSMPIQGHFLDV